MLSLGHRLAALLLVTTAGAALALGPAAPAAAHQRAALTLVTPREDQLVGPNFQLEVLAGGGAFDRVDFTVRLDGALVDTAGGVGGDSVFTTFSLRAGERLRLQVRPPEPGEHELRLVYARDPDDPQDDVVRRFSSVRHLGEFRPIGEVLWIWLVPAAAGAVIAGAVLYRRRRRVRPVEPG